MVDEWTAVSRHVTEKRGGGRDSSSWGSRVKQGTFYLTLSTDAAVSSNADPLTDPVLGLSQVLVSSAVPVLLL
jgi:hypothetical protein